MLKGEAEKQTMAMVEETEMREGNNLLGSPTFTQLEHGRLKCVETGHELLPKDKDSYSHSKRCRLANNKPPLNMFKQDPASRSKLICKLAGDTVNKSEEHVWKHINGKRFLNKLEQKETGNFEEEVKLRMDTEEKKKQKEEKPIEEVIYEVRDCSDKDSDSESEEVEFWERGGTSMMEEIDGVLMKNLGRKMRKKMQKDKTNVH